MKIKTLAMFAASGLMAASLAHVTPAFAEDFFDEDVGNQQFALADNSGTGANMPADMGADTNAGNTGDTSAMNDGTRDNAGMNDGAADNAAMGGNAQAADNATPSMNNMPSNTAPSMSNAAGNTTPNMKNNAKATTSPSMNSGAKQNAPMSGKPKSTAPAPATSSTKGATSMNGEAGSNNMAAAAPVQQFFPNQNQASEQQAGGYQMLASNTNVNQQNQANTGVNQQSANNTQSRQQSATSNAPASEQPTADVPSGDEDF